MKNGGARVVIALYIGFLRDSMAADSVVNCWIWRKIKLARTEADRGHFALCELCF